MVASDSSKGPFFSLVLTPALALGQPINKTHIGDIGWVLVGISKVDCIFVYGTLSLPSLLPQFLTPPPPRQIFFSLSLPFFSSISNSLYAKAQNPRGGKGWKRKSVFFFLLLSGGAAGGEKWLLEIGMSSCVEEGPLLTRPRWRERERGEKKKERDFFFGHAKILKKRRGHFIVSLSLSHWCPWRRLRNGCGTHYCSTSLGPFQGKELPFKWGADQGCQACKGTKNAQYWSEQPNSQLDNVKKANSQKILVKIFKNQPFLNLAFEIQTGIPGAYTNRGGRGGEGKEQKNSASKGGRGRGRKTERERKKTKVNSSHLSNQSGKVVEGEGNVGRRKKEGKAFLLSPPPSRIPIDSIS